MLLSQSINVLGLPLSACHCLAALSAKMCMFNSLMEKKRLLPQYKVKF